MAERGRDLGAALPAAALAIVVAVIHVEDQGGLTALDDPTWLGWAYRLLEVGAVLTAAALLSRRLPLLAWGSALLVGAGPMVGYLLSRTTGLPGSSDDIGNWGEPLGVVSLFVEGALIVVALASLAAAVRGTEPARGHRLASR